MAARMIFAGVLLALGGCAYDRADGGGEGLPYYSGGSYGPNGVGGTGARALDPWLAGSSEGRALILARFDRNRNGEIGEDRAEEANRWFRRFADTNRDLRLTDREIKRGLERVGRELGAVER